MTRRVRTLAVIVLAASLLAGLATTTTAMDSTQCTCSLSTVSVQGAADSANGDGLVRVRIDSSNGWVDVETEVSAGNVAVDVGPASAAVGQESSSSVVVRQESSSSSAVSQESSSSVVVSQESSSSVVQHVSQVVSGDGEVVVGQESSRRVETGANRSVAASSRSVDCVAWSIWRLGLPPGPLFGCS